MKEATSQKGDNPPGPGEQLQATQSEPNPAMSELKILLVGKRGVGKSTAGNRLLGKRVFKTKFSDDSVTQTFKSESRIWREWKVSVIDSPDLSLKDFKSDLREHIRQGPHAFLLVTPLGSFTEKDEVLLNTVQSSFGDKFTKYMTVLFTRKEDLEGQNVGTVLSSSVTLQKLIQGCEYRHITFNYRAAEEEEQCQVDELLQTIVQMVKRNGDKPCDFIREGPGEQLQATQSEPNPAMSELKILLVGKRGVGKSTAGNRLLGKRVFETKFSDDSVTQTFKSESRIWREWKVSVIDSPDLSLKDFKSDLREHIRQGPHAFLLVTPLGSFTEKDEVLLNTVQSSFGDKFTKYMTVLFTRKEDLEGQNVGTVLSSSVALQKLIQGCEYRHITFNYRAAEEEEQCQVDELLQTIVQMVQRNGDKPCDFIREVLNIVLVGRIGTGKSATGNAILGSSIFLSKLRAQPVTTTCQVGRRTWAEQDVVVVDTPGLCMLSSSQSQVEEVRRYVSSSERNTVLVLVLQLGRFIAEDQKVVVMLKTIFGKDVMDYMIVLFTRKEDLGNEDIKDYCKSTENKFLKEIIKKCGERVCAFNNRETGQAMEDQVKGLLKMANELICKRKGHRDSGPKDAQGRKNSTNLAMTVKHLFSQVAEVPGVSLS